jgi:hypothetical protein
VKAQGPVAPVAFPEGSEGPFDLAIAGYAGDGSRAVPAEEITAQEQATEDLLDKIPGVHVWTAKDDGPAAPAPSAFADGIDYQAYTASHSWDDPIGPPLHLGEQGRPFLWPTEAYV